MFGSTYLRLLEQAEREFPLMGTLYKATNACEPAVHHDDYPAFIGESPF